MKPGETRYLMMPVIPIIEELDATVTVKISAYTPLRHDFEEVEIEVVVNLLKTMLASKFICVNSQHDGVTDDNYIPYLVDLVNQGSQLIPDFSTDIPERFVVPGQAELLYVPGSNFAEMMIHGNHSNPSNDCIIVEYPQVMW
jgi:hypothetical protein